MSIGDLVIKMSADTATLASDMGRAVHIMQKSAGEIDRAFTSLKTAALGIGSAIGAGLGGAGMAAFIGEAVTARARLEEMAKITGDAVVNLDGLRRVSVVSGVGMDQLQTSLARLARGMNSMDDDGKAAGAAIKSIGLDVDVLRAKKPGEAMLDIALALNKFEDGASKVAVAVALMGRNGAAMLPFLKDLAEQGDLQGRITGEQAMQALELEKAWRRLTLAFQDGKEILANGIIPRLGDFIEANREMIKIAGSASEAARLFVFNLDAMTSEKPREEIVRLTDALLKYQQASSFGKFMQSPTGFIFGGREDDLKKQIEFLKYLQRQEALALPGAGEADVLTRRFNAKPLLGFKLPSKLPAGSTAPTAFETLKRQYDEMLAKTGELTEAQKLLNLLATERYTKLPPAQQAELDAKKNLLVGLATEIDLKKSLAIYAKDQLDAEKAADDAATQFAQSEIKRLATLRDKYTELIDPLARFRKQFEEIAELRTKFPFMAGTLDLAELEVQKKWREEMEQGKRLTSDIADAAHELGYAFSNAFEDAVISGRKLKDVLKSLEAAILHISNRIFVTKPLEKWLDSLASGSAGFGGGAQSAPDFIGRIGNWLSGTQAPAPVVELSLPAFDVGTPFVPRDMVAVVHKGEAIIPAGGNAGREVTVNNVFNFPSGTAEGFRASASQVATQVGAAVAAATRRNG